MTGTDHPFRSQNLAETLGQAGRAEDFAEKKKGSTRVWFLGNREQRVLELRVGSELLGPGVEPGIHACVGDTKFRLQFAREALRVVHEKARVDPEEASEQFARCVGQMGPRTVFDLRKVGLTEPAAEFPFHGLNDFGLGHGATETTKRTLDGAKGAEFVAEGHGKGLS